MDNAVGNIVNSLKEAGMYDNSLILFSTDNGGSVENFSNYPLRGHKEMLYEGGVRGVAFVTGGAVKKKSTNNNG